MQTCRVSSSKLCMHMCFGSTSAGCCSVFKTTTFTSSQSQLLICSGLSFANWAYPSSQHAELFPIRSWARWLLTGGLLLPARFSVPAALSRDNALVGFLAGLSCPAFLPVVDAGMQAPASYCCHAGQRARQPRCVIGWCPGCRVAVPTPGLVREEEPAGSLASAQATGHPALPLSLQLLGPWWERLPGQSVHHSVQDRDLTT